MQSNDKRAAAFLKTGDMTNINILLLLANDELTACAGDTSLHAMSPDSVVRATRHRSGQHWDTAGIK
jgi:hypothetical protein